MMKPDGCCCQVAAEPAKAFSAQSDAVMMNSFDGGGDKFYHVLWNPVCSKVYQMMVRKDQVADDQTRRAWQYVDEKLHKWDFYLGRTPEDVAEVR